MPTYEYKCENCGYEFEKFQNITSPSLRKCPSCKKPSLKRLIGSGAGIIFKGNGFYQTDYRSESYKKAEKKEKGLSEESKSKSEDKKEPSKTTTETKTETKKPPKDKK